MPTYSKAPEVVTGGFLPQENFLNLPAPIDTSTTGLLKTVFEPSPVFATKGWPAWISGVVNLTLHVICLVFTAITAGRYLPPPNSNSPTNKDFTTYHEVDFVRSWIVTAITCEAVLVPLTVLYFGCVKKAFILPIIGHIVLALQLTATLSMALLVNWIATAATADKSMRDSDADWTACVAFYSGVCVIAGMVMTPMSGIYYKTQYP
jgi:hypothetical protein